MKNEEGRAEVGWNWDEDFNANLFTRKRWAYLPPYNGGEINTYLEVKGF